MAAAAAAAGTQAQAAAGTQAQAAAAATVTVASLVVVVEEVKEEAEEVAAELVCRPGRKAELRAAEATAQWGMAVARVANLAPSWQL